MFPRIAALVAVLVAVLLVLAAGGRPAHADVTWRAPAACPDRAALLARVGAELGRPVDEATTRVEGVVTRAGERWRAVVHLGAGRRELEARSCDELVATVALIVAMAIDAESGDAAPDPPPVGALDGEEPPGGVVITPRPAPAATTQPALELRIRASVGGDAGALPDLASGVGGGIEAARGAWSIDTSAQRWLEQRAFSQPEQGARLGLTTVTLAVCRRLLGDQGWRVAACAGGELDALTATPFGFDAPAPRQTLWGGGALAAASLTRHVAGPLWLRVDVAASLLVVRVGYREGDAASPDMLGVSVHEMDRIVARGFVSAEVHVR